MHKTSTKSNKSTNNTINAIANSGGCHLIFHVTVIGVSFFPGLGFRVLVVPKQRHRPCDEPRLNITLSSFCLSVIRLR